MTLTKLLSQWTGKSSFFKLIPQSIISPRTILLTRASITSSFSCKDTTSSLLWVHFLRFSWWNSLPCTIRKETQTSSNPSRFIESLQHCDNPLTSFSTYKVVFFVFDLFFIDLENFWKPIVLNKSMYICIFVYYIVPFFFKKGLYYFQW